MTDQVPAPAPSQPVRRGPGTAARLGCSIFAIVAIFGLLELGARVAGAGDPMAFGGSKLLYQQIYPPLFVPTASGKLRPRDPRLVDRSFPKQASGASRGDAERVFVFGESAVKGLGMSENASFSRALERQLRNAGSQAVVVNTGIVALDSRQIIACVKDAVATAKPEWVVLHVGNNEFLETHAWRFLKASGTLPTRAKIDDVLSASRLYLALKQAGVRGRTKNLTPEMFSIESLRGGGGPSTGATEDPGSERELVKKIEAAGLGVTRDEIQKAGDVHKEHMREAIRIAKAAGAHVILMTVATNLEWEGVKDPEGGWLKKAIPDLSTDPVKRKQQLEATVQANNDIALKAAHEEPLEHWHSLYMRAVMKRALGDVKGAREDFQAANDQDPHLRRCLSFMNENMRALAKEEGVDLVDGERVLAAASTDGITGFDMLYDYVHFTPEGNERLAAELAKTILGPKADAAAIDAFVGKRREQLAAAKTDSLSVEEYIGFHGDRAMLSDRDLWKYEKNHDELDHNPDPRKKDDKPGKIQQGTATPDEIVWAANYAALQVGGEARARELYALAKTKKPELAPVIDANVKWLDARN